tara:strand:+ start:3862 stop:6975 length:3114 start_codon:yes stop_codon:yes gene_type:complete
MPSVDPSPTPTPTPSPTPVVSGSTVYCPSDYVTGSGQLDHSLTGTGTTGGFIVDVEVRLNSALNNVYHLEWPAQPGTPVYCTIQPEIIVQRGQTVIFRQDHVSNGDGGYSGLNHPFYIATDTAGSAGSYEYSEGVTYREGITGSTVSNPYTPGAGSVTCPNIKWVVPQCAPNTLYYRCRNHNEMGGVITVQGDSACTGAVTGCTGHERPFDEILPLVLSDTFFEWYQATNEIIAAVNPIRIYDINLRGGLRDRFNQGGSIGVEIDYEAGGGTRTWPPDPVTGGEFAQQCHPGKLRLDFFGMSRMEPTGSIEPFEDGPTGSAIKDSDLFAFERIQPYRGTLPDDIAGELYAVEATNMLPPTLAGNHRFTGLVTFENPITNVGSTEVQIDDINIQLGHSPFITMELRATGGASSLEGLVAGISHDPDGDGIYYEGGGVTGELLTQTVSFFDPGHEDLSNVTGSTVAKATLLSFVTGPSSVTGTATLRSYNDIPFVTDGTFVIGDRSGITASITSLAGQAGSDTDIDGGGITLVSNNSTTGDKKITWKNTYDAWELNQNLRIDSNFGILTPFNITSDSTPNLATDDFWKVTHHNLASEACLPTGSGEGALTFSYYANSASTGINTLSLLNCGGIYIHNLTCSSQFSETPNPCSVVVSNKYGLINQGYLNRVDYADANNMPVGHVVRIIDNTGSLTGAMADSSDNAEVFGIIVQHVTGGYGYVTSSSSGCTGGLTVTGGSVVECGERTTGSLVAVQGATITWKTGWAGLTTPLVTGSAYFLSPLTGGYLTTTEPLDVGYVRKPVCLALGSSKMLLVNYAGVVNGDYFDENPVTRLTELRDVTIGTNPTGTTGVNTGDVLYYDGVSEQWVNEPFSRINSSLNGLVTGTAAGATNINKSIQLTITDGLPHTKIKANMMYLVHGKMMLTNASTTGSVTGNAYVSSFIGTFTNNHTSDVSGLVTGDLHFTDDVVSATGLGTTTPAMPTGANFKIGTGGSPRKITMQTSTRDIILDFYLQITGGSRPVDYNLATWIEHINTTAMLR